MPGYFVDTNVWIASNFEGHPHNSRAIALFDGCSEGFPLFLSRTVEISTLRLLSTSSLCRAYSAPPLTNQQAVAVLADWRSQDRVRCLDVESEGIRAM